MEGRITTVGGIAAVIYDQGEADASDSNATTLIAYES